MYEFESALSESDQKREKPTPEPKAAFEAVQELVNALDGDLDDCITNADLSVLCSKKAIVFTEDEIQEVLVYRFLLVTSIDVHSR